MMLGILRHFDIASLPVDSVECLHLQIEAMKLAFADAHRYIADPEWMDVEVAALLDEGYLEERAGLIERTRAIDFQHGTPKPGGTVLLTTADADGNMVSFIQSNYAGFGSGMVVPGTGIALQNRGGCFTLERGHPNEIGPGKRPYHTIIPGFVTVPGPDGAPQPLMAFGVMGGFMQPQGHAQVISRLRDHAQNPQAVLDAPRWQVKTGLEVSVEPGFDAGVYDGLAALGHVLERAQQRNASFGRGQIIYRLDEGGYVAASDLRADGQAVGY
jgi:gamma-glutamyltranspeptidase/glutathione hydrolase